jgi:Family of unknown function (DUF6464)
MLDRSVIKIVFIIILSLLPSLIWWIVSPSLKQRWQSRLRRTRLMTAYNDRVDLLTSYQSSEIEFDRYFVGNVNCRFNAHSPYIRCAVNPSGPCEDCSHYENRE